MYGNQFPQYLLHYGYQLKGILYNPLKGILHLNSPPNGSVQLSFTLKLCVTRRVAGGSDGRVTLDDSLQQDLLVKTMFILTESYCFEAQVTLRAVAALG